MRTIFTGDGFWGVSDGLPHFTVVCLDIGCAEVLTIGDNKGNLYAVNTEDYANNTEVLAMSDVTLQILSA